MYEAGQIIAFIMGIISLALLIFLCVGCYKVSAENDTRNEASKSKKYTTIQRRSNGDNDPYSGGKEP